MSTTFRWVGQKIPQYMSTRNLNMQSQHAIIITGDKDFSNILAYPPPHAGIVVVEISDTLPPDARKRSILRELAGLGDQSLENTPVIIEMGRARIRH